MNRRFLKRASHLGQSLSALRALVRLDVPRRSRRPNQAVLSVLLAVFAIVALTGTIGYHYYDEPQLTVNTPAPQTIYAPEDAIVEDKIATSDMRQSARQASLNVFTISETLNRGN